MPRTQASTNGRKAKSPIRARRRVRQEPVTLALLKTQHGEVDRLFKRFAKANDSEKAEIVQMACRKLTAHAQLEEELFYPALRDAGVEHALLDEAEVEHESVKRLVGELEAMQPGDDLYDAKVTVLAEYVKHHVKEEETEIFPDAKRADVDLDELGGRMEARAVELEGQTDA